MCDDLTADDNDRFLGTRAGVSRREFGALAGAAGLIAALPVPANAKPITGRDVTITTPDGVCDAYFAAPSRGKAPAVLVWPDIMGLRPAFRQMGDRLAQSGFAVLTVNQFYRSTKAPFLAPGESFDQPEVRARIAPWRAALSQDGTRRDARTFVDWLDRQPQVDTRRGIGTTGYCMGGPMTMLTATERPDRVRAGASFHGGGLATDRPDSPHLGVPAMKAGFLFAVAENDDQRNPAEKDKLRDAYAAAKLPAEIEVYAGTLHGWCPPDSRVYNAAQAEKAWGRLLALFDGGLRRG
ncbi:dienelactone hydrolase family protein [Sphingomonas sp. SFZ2018-12]|uniref:dienelactone hydrolase family protein n=1 Tax=Sphingomonas sp. SFZ2018-12 TaxID=2683197 RepID=UPI001F0E190B|nr:dienelactone hydrolase family protein [Sphingomonas sp. SFZ2018-12]MCH4894227.1 dienelactone hydrolase family protein [Sphingomonas sp. SFZ2018-12]